MLFVLFINDLAEAVVSELLLYADVSKIYRTIKNDSMSLWSDVWLLNFHPDKLKKKDITVKK